MNDNNRRYFSPEQKVAIGYQKKIEALEQKCQLQSLPGLATAGTNRK
jgi:hypothetical protein